VGVVHPEHLLVEGSSQVRHGCTMTREESVGRLSNWSFHTQEEGTKDLYEDPKESVEIMVKKGAD
jgi:hypothetical protein